MNQANVNFFGWAGKLFAYSEWSRVQLQAVFSAPCLAYFPISNFDSHGRRTEHKIGLRINCEIRPLQRERLFDICIVLCATEQKLTRGRITQGGSNRSNHPVIGFLPELLGLWEPVIKLFEQNRRIFFLRLLGGTLTVGAREREVIAIHFICPTERPLQ